MKALKIQLFILCVFGVIASGDLYAFNGEEHKILADTGASQVVVPPSVLLPENLVFNEDSHEYLDFLKYTKRLATGFDTNDTDDYDEYAPKVQDNCYWGGFPQYSYGQHDFNEILHIPDEKDIPERTLQIPTYTGCCQKDPFSMEKGYM